MEDVCLIDNHERGQKSSLEQLSKSSIETVVLFFGNLHHRVSNHHWHWIRTEDDWIKGMQLSAACVLAIRIYSNWTSPYLGTKSCRKRHALKRKVHFRFVRPQVEYFCPTFSNIAFCEVCAEIDWTEHAFFMMATGGFFDQSYTPRKQDLFNQFVRLSVCGKKRCVLRRAKYVMRSVCALLSAP